MKLKQIHHSFSEQLRMLLYKVDNEIGPRLYTSSKHGKDHPMKVFSDWHAEGNVKISPIVEEYPWDLLDHATRHGKGSLLVAKICFWGLQTVRKSFAFKNYLLQTILLLQCALLLQLASFRKPHGTACTKHSDIIHSAIHLYCTGSGAFSYSCSAHIACLKCVITRIQSTSSFWLACSSWTNYLLYIGVNVHAGACWAIYILHV